jgi:hypothetical protein
MELTDEEKKNGWTEEKLEKYVLERERAQAGVIMFHPDYRKPRKPRFANNHYRPLHWRR